MSDGTLRPLEMNDTPLYGPKGLLVCGLDEDQASQLEHLIKAMNWQEVPIAYAGIVDINTPVKELFETKPQNQGPMGGVAVIMGGLTGKQLHQIMAAWRVVELPPCLWATLQEESSAWPLASLLKHLATEHQQMMEARKKEQQASAPDA